MRTAALARAFARTLWLQRRLRSRSDVERWQAARLEGLRRQATGTVDFYRAYAGQPFDRFPTIDKGIVMGAFDGFNRLGLSAAAAWPVAEGAAILPGYDVGCSTGTSGNRGLYVVSDAERFAWLGTMLAKTIPDVFIRRHRVAVILPRASALYDAANQSRLLKLLFLDLRDGIARLAAPLAAFAPTVLVAPPRILRWLAEQGVAIAPSRVFSGAEPLEDIDRAIIETRFGGPVRDIYMATEGLLGVACARGTLHLAEDVMHFELRPVGADPHLVSPVLTDLIRRTQIMARYRLDDLLQMRTEPCACGSPYRAVAAVLGRTDDIFRLAAAHGGPFVLVTPDILRNAVVAADRTIDDFHIVQSGPRAIDLTLPPSVAPAAAGRAAADLAAACARAGAAASVTLARDAIPMAFDRKRRRVEARWKPGRA